MGPPLSSPPAAGAASREGRTRAVLFDDDGSDRQVAVDTVDLHALSERQLLWIDHEGEHARALLQTLGLGDAVPALDHDDGRPQLQNFGDWFLVKVVVVAGEKRLECRGQSLLVLSGRNFVVTVHRQPLEYLAQLGDREQADTHLGVLSAEGFTASLLDWQMSTYFDAVAELEADVDRLEVQLLERPLPRGYVKELAVLRRAASQLRRLLTPHRQVYGAMARPDFRPDADEGTQQQCRALSERFDRTLDAVEAARELVIGSFELFATHTAQRTNEIMRTLTFVTVLLGTLAVVAGVLGMNFQAPIFKTGTIGFVTTIVAMGILVAVAMVVAKRRRWW
ncbi:CorA family divalent cation transporter [Lysobacter yangpyeongensis]|uniref:CorA family divalent cation transporter n=1 Tax=Lysobacter yangpyeongensis TaxID=346182 RepID=A0ABW0SPV8_9GAMM